MPRLFKEPVLPINPPLSITLVEDSEERIVMALVDSHSGKQVDWVLMVTKDGRIQFNQLEKDVARRAGIALTSFGRIAEGK